MTAKALLVYVSIIIKLKINSIFLHEVFFADDKHGCLMVIIGLTLLISMAFGLNLKNAIDWFLEPNL